MKVADTIRGQKAETYTFRQFGLDKPRKLANGRTYLGRPTGWPTWRKNEAADRLHVLRRRRRPGLQTTVGLGQGKMNLANGVAMNGYDNMSAVQRREGQSWPARRPRAEDVRDEEGPGGRGHAPQVPAPRRRRQLGQEREHRQCEALTSQRRARRGALAAIRACAVAGPALAGGPAVRRPRRRARSSRCTGSGTVKVYLDKGEPERRLAVLTCECDQNGNWVCVKVFDGPVLDQQAGDDLVAATVAQWSGVPTSSFRAAIAGRSPVDITGANVYDYIGKYNGGGIQTIYDADNSVIDGADGRRRLRRARHRLAGVHVGAATRRRSSRAGRSSAARSSMPRAPTRSRAS